MASFTDQVPTFNSYVSQQPVESMVQVGMMKQQQYDTNLEKIYQSMSNVAGMDIMKDSDQEYLKNKMNDTSKKLRVFAAGDFSQNNLTRGVNNMVNNIADDEIVQTAVQSTARVRSEVSKMTKAQEKGESSVVNEYYLNKDINQWLQGETPGESFNGAWTPYTDVDAKLREVYESMEDTDITIQNPFRRDANGNTLYYASDGSVTTDPTKGEKRIDHAMLEKTVKGKSAEKILNNFYTSLSADEIRQLDMNGGYHYRGATAQSFAPAIKEAAETKKEFYKNSIKQIAIELESNPNLSADQRKKYSETAKEYQNSLNTGEIDKEVQKQLSGLEDPATLEAMKTSIYKDQYLRNMALNMETESVSIEYKSNPYFDADMKMKNYNLNVREFNNKVAHQDRMYGLQRAQFEYKMREEQFAGQGRVRAGDVSTDINEEDISYASYEKANLEADTQIQNLGTRVIPFTSLQMLDIEEDATRGLNEKQITGMKLDALDTMYKSWKGGKTFENANLNSYFTRREHFEEEKMLNNALMSGADKASSEVTKEIDALHENYPGFTVDGNYFTFKEISEVKADYTKFSKKGPVGYDPEMKRAIYGMVPDMEALSNMYAGTKKGILLERLHAFNINNEESEEAPMRAIWNTLNDASEVYGGLVKERDLQRSEYLRENSYKLASKKSTLDMSVKPLKNKVNNLIDEVSNDAGSIGAVDAVKNISFEDVNKFRNDDNTAYTIEKYHDGSGALILDNGTLSDDPMHIPLSSDQLASYFPRTQQNNRMEKATRFIRANGGLSNTSNMYGPNAAATAVYTANDFPSIANKFTEPNNIRFDIKADISNTGDIDYDKFNLIMYVKDPNTDSWIMQEDRNFVNLSTIEGMIGQFGPITANEIIRKNYNKQKTIE